MAEITVDRLNRIEHKIDELSKVLTNIARVEERMVALFRRIDEAERREREMDSRVEVLEINESRRGYLFGFVDRLWWIVVTVTVTSVGWFLRGGL